MKIRIVEATSAQGGTRVAFHADSSWCLARDHQGVGLWKGRRPPCPDHEYDAEFNVGSALEDVSSPDASGLTGFEWLGEDTRIHGTLEQLDDDGVACLRVAIDCIIMVESYGTIEVGTRLTLVVPWTQLHVYVQDA